MWKYLRLCDKKKTEIWFFGKNKIMLHILFEFLKKIISIKLEIIMINKYFIKKY